MIKGSRPFFIITFLMSFGMAFYIANRAFPIFTSADPYVKQVELQHSKALPFTDDKGSVLEQLIGIEPNTVQLVYKLPSLEAYKVDVDSLTQSLEQQYNVPSKKVHEFITDAPQNLTLEYIFKDKNNTKLVGFSKQYVPTK
ncbi:hypothetical protein K5I29_02685 [Flavobacterium agricola]|uniref:Uncharacterized protein n=1 Tax=Flavobacterium agricola TaxID=2870839 RepID=A0ABY6M032_9FLAO|nr:hypothetical protein [Flavobacterium agricola]UYW01844.1 hypothetical protein K5I29_02685 [Flavobacterium agricola]